jgi:hypothetical protein
MCGFGLQERKVEMVGVTERAKQELKNILNANVDNPLARLRLAADDQERIGLAVDVEQPGDHVVEHEGSGIMVAEEGLADSLTGITLDVQDTPEGPKLFLSKDS